MLTVRMVVIQRTILPGTMLQGTRNDIHDIITNSDVGIYVCNMWKLTQRFSIKSADNVENVSKIILPPYQSISYQYFDSLRHFVLEPISIC